jgi:hypothetical protein
MSHNRPGAQGNRPRKKEKEIASTFRYGDVRLGKSSGASFHGLNQLNCETLPRTIKA